MKNNPRRSEERGTRVGHVTIAYSRLCASCMVYTSVLSVYHPGRRSIIGPWRWCAELEIGNICPSYLLSRCENALTQGEALYPSIRKPELLNDCPLCRRETIYFQVNHQHPFWWSISNGE